MCCVSIVRVELAFILDKQAMYSWQGRVVPHPTQPSANHTYHNAFWLHKSGWEHCAKVQNTQNGPLIIQTKHFVAEIPNARGILNTQTCRRLYEFAF